MEPAFRLNIEEGIANVVFDLPGEKVNTFSLPVLEQLEGIVDSAAQNKSIRAMTISSAKENVYIAGADLHSFEPMAHDSSHVDKMIETGHRVFDKLSNLPFPTIALINGACLGGGMEMALACTYRVVSDHPKTMLGLPEVTLGIIPGWGGTQRMPRLVGLMEGLPLILGGKPIKANKAWKIKLADALVAAEFFNSKSNEFVKYCLTAEGRKNIANRRKQKGLNFQLIENNPLGRAFLFYQAEKDVLAKTKGQYPAPLVALSLVKETCKIPLKEGLRREIDTFKQNVATSFANAQNLIHLFFAQEALKKDPGATITATPMKVNSAAVIGAGTMGSGIAWLFSNKEIPVRMKDVDWVAVGKGYGAAYAIYAKMLKDKKVKPHEMSMKFHRISGAVDYSGFKQVDLVVEAAVESLDLKHKILRELEDVVRPNVIIGTNTSSLTISEMGTVMAHPDRLVGMHFFNPANRMPLVEVVASKKTSPEAVATAVDVCRKLGKTPIVVGDCPGFLVNRIFITGANEVMRMYEEGADYKALEEMMLNFGMPMSPFVLADEVGNDVGYKAGKVFEQAYGERMAVPKILTSMYNNKLYGKKTGVGFFIYKGNSKTFNPEIEKLRNSLKMSGRVLTEIDMRNRVFLLMINEASRCLEEKIINKPSNLDMALVLGIGFPPFRGGLLRYADMLGINYVVDQLKHLEGLYGERFAPSNKLLEMQRKGEKFYPK